MIITFHHATEVTSSLGAFGDESFSELVSIVMRIYQKQPWEERVYLILYFTVHHEGKLRAGTQHRN